MAVRWQVYPKSQRPGKLVHDIAEVFRAQESRIGTPPNKPQSRTVLNAVRDGLSELGFVVEDAKDKVDVPILFGVNGQVLKSFQVDAWHREEGAILEVEAGIAVDARKVYQDLFEAMVMPEVRFLCIAVQNAYHPSRRRTPFDDFERTKAIFEALFESRVQLPLETIMLLGY